MAKLVKPMCTYNEGDWFAVPLRDGGFASGIIARAMPRKEGIVLGYFFGPRHKEVPALEGIDTGELAGLPRDGLSGAGAVETMLTRLLA